MRLPLSIGRCLAVLGLCSTVVLVVNGQSPPLQQPLSASSVSLATPAAFVQALPQEVFHRTPADARARRLVRAYYNSVLKWDDVLLARLEPAPGRPRCAYYGEGRNVENDVRPITYAAMVNAFLAEFAPPGSRLSPEQQMRMRADAIGALRYLVQGHVTGRGSCLNGKRWGDQWQSAMWARSAGLAGWFLWDELPDDLKEGVARLVEFEADRFLKLKPKSRYSRDTGAEENAWNAQILSLACNMMPAHPRTALWAEAASLWMYNSLSVPADSQNAAPGDGGRAIRDWVCTTNAHSDFTVENHGIVHVGYLKNTFSMLLESALPYLLTGAPVPRACQHHTAEGFEVVLRCMGWDAAPIYFSGNDWKLVQTQPTDAMSYAFMSLLASDRNAAYLEELALDRTARLQRVEGGFYNVRRDLEYGGVCATRMIAACLAHRLIGSGAKPATPADFNRHISGVTLLEHGKVLLHRTPTKFASFSWGLKRMALALPTDGNSLVWPHFASYVGQINGQDASAANATLRAFHHEIRSNGFTVTATLGRFKGAVEQAVSFTSLPGDTTVYMERFKVAKGFELRARETGIVGLEYDLGRNERVLYTAKGKIKTLGTGGEPNLRLLQTDWLNIADRVGYVVCREPECRNVMRHHNEAAGSGRVPKLQEWLSLIGDDVPRRSSEDWACLVTFLNQNHKETAKAAKQVQFTVETERAVCRTGNEEVRFDLASPVTQ